MNTKSSYRCGAEDELGCGEEIHKDENGMDIQNGAEHDPKCTYRYPHHRHGDWAGERENCPYQVCKDLK